MELTLYLLKLILPEFLIDNFDLVKYINAKQILHLYFEEKITAPKEFSNLIIIVHGFHKEITVQDFPIRGNRVYPYIKRRRWLDKNNS
ncbi:ISAon1 family transposase N-terminal region protein [Wenyingzhuangia gilva]|uniref:ISAon1 family transposase N-terminal region protein n=1 Tax=Wenyingzhuangia gilva TaxID=3057677 RepID=UPI00267482FD|nr:transposase [Wenyingzhuangia sp. chi5]